MYVCNHIKVPYLWTYSKALYTEIESIYKQSNTVYEQSLKGKLEEMVLQLPFESVIVIHVPD